MTGLLQQLTQAEAAQKSAEEIRVKTQGEMNELRTNSDAAMETIKAEAKDRGEMAKVKDEAAVELSRVRQVATEEAEARVRETLQASQSAAAEANARASEAETKLSAPCFVSLSAYLRCRLHAHPERRQRLADHFLLSNRHDRRSRRWKIFPPCPIYVRAGRRSNFLPVLPNFLGR